MKEKIAEEMKHLGEDDTLQRLKDNIELYEQAIEELKTIDNEQVQEIIKDLEKELC